ncbi:MAG: uracil-DNA glycosylase [Flavobacteriales bacterium]|jgi:uracil-DNA glycosylase
MKTKIGNDWNGVLKDEFEKEYFEKLTDFVKTEYKSEVCFPPVKDIFNAFKMCSFSNTKIVILGQDPYHGKGQAHGLSFSVPEGMKIPPSLRNIFKELTSDLGVDSPTQGDLTSWAKQGVLLLNATLTVRKSTPESHQKQGWEEFTDSVIKTISNKKESVVIVLWGKFAEQKVSLIDESKHCIITSSHPSPFSAHRGFLGSKPFSKTNEFLEKKGIEKIDWELKNDQVKMEF